MPETVDHRGALFLRMAELLQGHALYTGASSARLALESGWLEIAPAVLREMDLIRLERHETIGEYVEAGKTITVSEAVE